MGISFRVQRVPISNAALPPPFSLLGSSRGQRRFKHFVPSIVLSSLSPLLRLSLARSHIRPRHRRRLWMASRTGI
ncbi:hypothetical protein GW17_00039390 [Ensete ventricosum]|nr:hypothetical protein GW17_00039390 [Ensete ventricosum]